MKQSILNILNSDKTNLQKAEELETLFDIILFERQ